MHARQRSPELAAGPVRAIRTALDPAHVAASVCCTCLLLPCCCLALLLAYPLCAIVPAAAVSVSVSLETALMPPAPPPDCVDVLCALAERTRGARARPPQDGCCPCEGMLCGR